MSGRKLFPAEIKHCSICSQFAGDHRVVSEASLDDCMKTDKVMQ